MTRIVSASLVCVVLGAMVACRDDPPSERFVDMRVLDGGDRDGDDDDAGTERRFYARFCENYGLGTCTEAETEPVRACYQDVCHPQYMACDFPCSSYIKCIDRCDCEDRRCVSRCERPDVCTDCLFANICDTMLMCASILPACAEEPPEHSCAELEACCPEIRGEPKVDCEETAAEGDAEACGFAFGWYCGQPS